MDVKDRESPSRGRGLYLSHGADSVPTRAEVQKGIMDQERVATGTSGEAEWIRRGLDLQQEQLSVAHAARIKPADASGKAELALATQRQKLERGIREFNAAAARFIPGSLFLKDWATIYDGSEWTALFEEDLAPQLPGVEGEGRPEKIPLFLPSTFGADYLLKNRLKNLAKKEADLRMAEMNDSLHAIRVGIGYKSYLYFAKVRNASSTRARLRSFDDVNAAERNVAKHTRNYMQSRDAFFKVSFALSKEEQERKKRLYKPVKKEDLGVNTAIAEPFTRGLRNWHASWIWTFSDDAENPGEWEHRLRRSMWLRGYARKRRWTEELVLVQFEMECVVRSFSSKAQEWKELAAQEEAATGRHIYALAEKARWEELEARMKGAFEAARATYKQ
ncbi:uncharacterized protein BXZ73DRAFT_50185 [Epithele typhae]|uniref:uncharacterized protein n=1 Tax=Epithele typhae TaxID=378194 RepID=UPI0020089017|nr:uncharacterized protein BXZ73DRAFT_50185 [Epithele typhae]KAH9925041.1 hypothetical protein BXZ73DRAFT_50185 [Epithele typhae]